MSDFTTATVRMWEHKVGFLAESADGEIDFEDASDFQKCGLEISPVHLPLRTSGPRSSVNSVGRAS